MNRAARSLALFFGVGRLPWAPGTWASAAALPLFWMLMDRPWVHAGALILLMAVGIPACTVAEKLEGERDPNSVVLDEVVGMGTALLFLPKDPSLVVMAFILFRLFDIWKPWPIRRLQDLPGGWGIMVDDVLAGLYACAWLHAGSALIRQIA